MYNIKAPPRVYEKYSTRGCVERQIQHEVKLSAVFVTRHPHKCCIFQTDKQGGALIDKLYFRLDMMFFIELITELVSCRDN